MGRRHHLGQSRELFRAANGFLGHFRGGLGIATIAACGGFAAICGSSVATAATFSRVAYPEMRRYGYPQSFATGVIAAGGTLGIMIPPSTVFAVYGLITEQDVGKLFIAGILPGLLAVMMYILTINIIGFARPGYLPAGPRAAWPERLDGCVTSGRSAALYLVIAALWRVFPRPRPPAWARAGVLIGLLRGRCRADIRRLASGRRRRRRRSHRAGRAILFSAIAHCTQSRRSDRIPLRLWVDAMGCHRSCSCTWCWVLMDSLA